MPRKQKEPRVSSNPYKLAKAPPEPLLPARVKIPTVLEKAPSDDSKRKVRFSFDSIDHHSPWSLIDISRDDHLELLDFLGRVETMTEGELFRPGHRLCKFYDDFSRCPNPAATNRLAEKYEGLDSLTRLEINGLKRLYGVRVGNEFHIIWWDPNHEIWPAPKKHT